MPSSKNYKRDYKQERKTAASRGETSVGSSSGDAVRHRARRKYIAKHGEPPEGTEIDHKRTVKQGGSNDLSNLRARSISSNRSAGGKSGNTAGKARGGRK